MPKVDKVKLTKLRNVLAPLFSIRENYSYEDTHPTDEEGMTLVGIFFFSQKKIIIFPQGYCFVKYESKEAASVALVACDEHRLDKNHVFAAYPFSAIREIKKPDEKWEAPSKRAYQDLVLFFFGFFA
jgi:hypothetical protein